MLKEMYRELYDFNVKFIGIDMDIESNMDSMLDDYNVLYTKFNKESNKQGNAMLINIVQGLERNFIETEK